MEGVTLSVNAGEVYGFLGANGVGKTTLLKCIFHYITHDGGNIELFETKDYYDQKYFTRIGYAPEVTNLYPFLRGKELLHYMGKLAGMKSKEIEQRAKMLLGKLGLTFAEDRLISAYSK